MDVLVTFTPFPWDVPAYIAGVIAHRHGKGRPHLTASQWVPFSAGWATSAHIARLGY